MKTFLLPLSLGALLLAGCEGHEGEGHEREGHSDEGHSHVAPHGGALVVLGEEFAHLEFVCDPKSGVLEAYLLDGSADRGVRSDAAELIVVIADETPFEIRLEPVASALTGETVGDTSAFAGTDERLQGRTEFSARLSSFSLKGQSFEGVSFRYPEGNEDDVDDHDDED